MYMIANVYNGKDSIEQLPRLKQIDRNGKEKKSPLSIN